MPIIIDTILSVAQKLFGLRGELAKARQARKNEVADFLAAVAATVEEASASLQQGNYPHGKCMELLCHSQNMKAAIGDLVGEQQAIGLGEQLKEVWEIEQLHGELAQKTAAEKTRSLSVLDQAAGLFRATAAFVRVSP
jgi:uncharacterized protein YbgA (DUF1722 family)